MDDNAIFNYFQYRTSSDAGYRDKNTLFEQAENIRETGLTRLMPATRVAAMNLEQWDAFCSKLHSKIQQQYSIKYMKVIKMVKKWNSETKVLYWKILKLYLFL